MGHDHHDDRESYYLEQICTIALAGALGGVAVMMYTTPDGLFFLADRGEAWYAVGFRIPVFAGGIALLCLVALRAITLWVEVGKPRLAVADGSEAAECGHSHGAECGHEHHEHSHGAACEHDHHEHSHGAACEHDHHDHHEHSHGHSHSHGDDHGHSHGWNPWRFAVLLLPVVLFFMNLPNQEGFSASYIESLASRGGIGALGEEMRANYCPDVGVRLGAGENELPIVEFVEAESPAAEQGVKVGDQIVEITQSGTKDGEPEPMKGVPLEKVIDRLKGRPGTKVWVHLRHGEEKPRPVTLVRTAKVITVGFKELEPAAFSPVVRQNFGGRRVRITGQYMPGNDGSSFSLVRLKMTCCAADLTPLKMIIEAPAGLEPLKPLDWIRVEGQVQFRERLNGRGQGGEYITVLKVASADKVEKTDPEPFLQQ